MNSASTRVVLSPVVVRDWPTEWVSRYAQDDRW